MNNLTDAIQSFIKLVNDYLAQNDNFLVMYRSLMQPRPGSPDVTDTLSSALPNLSRELEAVRQRVIASGKKLANNIAATAGGDARSLLQFVNAIEKPRRVDSLGAKDVMGPAYDLWESLRTDLEQFAVRQGLPADNTGNNLSVNDRMIAIFTKDKRCVNWTQREWAEKFDVSAGAIAKTAAWKAISAERAAQKKALTRGGYSRD